MQYLDLLALMRDLLQPRTIVHLGADDTSGSGQPDIGAHTGAETRPVARAASPAAPTSTVEQRREDGVAADEPVDLAFISGPCYARVLRDFVEVERRTGPGSVIVIGDVLAQAGTSPADRGQAGVWAGDGDVWKIVPTLRELRPDLILMLVRTVPTGLLLVFGADRTNTDLEAALANPNLSSAGPGEPPVEFLTRATAVYPMWLISAPIWDQLRQQRAAGRSALDARGELLTCLRSWASTTLNDRQATAIHPTLTGRPGSIGSGPRRGRRAGTRPSSSRPAPTTGGGRDRTDQRTSQVLNVVRRRLTTLVRGGTRRRSEQQRSPGSH